MKLGPPVTVLPTSTFGGGDGRVLLNREGITIYFACFGPLQLQASDRHELATMGGME